MQTTFKIFVSFLFCFSLALLSGCGGSVNTVEKSEIDEKAILETDGAISEGSFTAAEKSEIDSFLATHGKKFGNNVKKTDQTGHTLLHTAAVNGDFVAVKYCISKGADVNAKTTNNGLTSLHMAQSKGCQKTTVVPSK